MRDNILINYPSMSLFNHLIISFSVCRHVHLWSREWNSFDQLTIVLRWSLRGTDARNLDHDPS